MKLYCWNVSFILFIAVGFRKKDVCLGAKLERKQDFFEVESFDNKREYGLSEIGKRGFSTLGFDYSTSPEYGLGDTNVVSSDYSNVRSGSSDETISSSPARDLIPPPPPGIYSSSSPPTKFGRISSSVPTKDFLSSHHHHHYTHHRSQISRRSPHLTLSHYYDEPGGGVRSGIRPRVVGTNTGNFGLVADNGGKLIGYRGSILPGYAESQSIVSSSPSGIIPDGTNFIGGYFPGSTSLPDYGKSKYNSLASSASSGSYTSTYRMRDEQSPSSEDHNDFTVGGSGTYQPSLLPQQPPPPLLPHHYHHPRQNDGILGHNHVLEPSRFLPYGRDYPPTPTGFSYTPLGKTLRFPYDYSNTQRGGYKSGPSSNSPSGYDVHSSNSVDRSSSPPYAYLGLGFNEYGSR